MLELFGRRLQTVRWMQSWRCWEFPILITIGTLWYANCDMMWMKMKGLVIWSGMIIEHWKGMGTLRLQVGNHSCEVALTIASPLCCAKGECKINGRRVWITKRLTTDGCNCDEIGIMWGGVNQVDQKEMYKELASMHHVLVEWNGLKYPQLCKLETS